MTEALLLSVHIQVTCGSPLAVLRDNSQNAPLTARNLTLRITGNEWDLGTSNNIAHILLSFGWLGATLAYAFLPEHIACVYHQLFFSSSLSIYKKKGRVPIYQLCMTHCFIHLYHLFSEVGVLWALRPTRLLSHWGLWCPLLALPLCFPVSRFIWH